MDVKLLSSLFEVRKLNSKDIDSIYHLCCSNKLFYQYHPPFVTKESILEDMNALPTGKISETNFISAFLKIIS